MTDQPLPSFYDSLDGSLEHALGLLSRGVKDRRSAFHTLTVATVGPDGRVEQRTVVNRGFDRPSRRLRFHTDRRAPKLDQLAANPHASVHIYDPRAKIQLRLATRATVHTHGTLHSDAWAATRPFSRECYRIEPAPGSVAPGLDDLTYQSNENVDAGFENFAVVTLQIDSLEWLYLAHQGHRRARYTWDDAETCEAIWLVP